MHDDDFDSEGLRPYWRLVGVVISVVLVSEYIVLGAATLALRTLFGLAAKALKRLLRPHDGPRYLGTPGAEAA